MKIETILITPGTGNATVAGAEVVKVKVTGPVDLDNAVVRRARELVQGTGSKAMIDSFDWAIQHGKFVPEE